MDLLKALPFGLILLTCPPFARAQVGVLDPTFGSGGLVTTDVSLSTYDDANAVLLQPDGKTIAAGTSGYDGAQDLAIVRYLMDGTLDPDFGTDGKVTVSISFGNDIATCLALQEDGKILVGGYSYLVDISFVLARLLPDGSVDTDFGDNGTVTTAIDGNTSIGRGLALQEDGKILFAGGGFGGFALVRYGSDGTIDPTFGTDGLSLCPFNGGGAQANAIALQDDGQIVLAGYASSKSGDSIAVARFDADGALDPTFSGDGTVEAALPGGCTASALAIADNGDIVVAGAASNQAMIARFTPAGMPDPTFYGTGIRKLTMPGISMSNAYAVTVQSDGKPIIAGVIGNATNDFLLVRMESDGYNYDEAFGTGGVVSTDFANNLDIGRAMAVQPNGSIVVAGTTNGGSEDRNFALARYYNNMTTGVPAAVPAMSDAAIWPDPLSSTSRVAFSLAVADKVTIDLLDASGRPVQHMYDAQQLPAGRHSAGLHVDTSLPPGAYVLRIRGGATLLHVNVMK
jgi:uncharacterized delta-60 repeat protein